MSKDSPANNECTHKDAQQFASWKNRLLEVGGELDSVSKAAEKTFLGVGDRLSDFYGRAREISKRSSAVAAGFSGVEVTDAIDGLRDLVDRSSAFLVKAEQDFRQDVGVLQGILKTMASIHKPITGFRKIVKNLRILSISTKIESAQLHENGDGFTTIADDVEKLSVLISDSFADILARAGVVSGSVEKTLSEVRALEGEQKEKARSILDDTRKAVTSLVEKNRASTETAGRVSMELERISDSIGEVVSSIQFHDITRQQLEHVKEALDVVAERLDRGLQAAGAPDHDKDMIALVRDARAVCTLQQAQLADSGEQFTGAAKSIIDNLQTIAATTKGLYGHLERLAGVENTTSSSFFSRIESEVASAVSFFGEMGDGIRELSKTVEGLATTVSDMSGFVDEIENIGRDVELIAVNARIKAAHTGSEGAPLGVIAEAIQRLSGEAQVQKDAVSEELREIISTVDRLRSRTNADTSRQTTETDGVLQELNSLLGGLRAVNESALASLAMIQGDGRKLAVDMEATADGIGVQREFEARIAGSIKTLESVVIESRARLPETEESAGSRYLETSRRTIL